MGKLFQYIQQLGSGVSGWGSAEPRHKVGAAAHQTGALHLPSFATWSWGSWIARLGAVALAMMVPLPRSE